MKKIAILQSNYIPWKGVFDMINQVDEFIFLEDVQFTKRDWRTRNQIFYNENKIWISIPTKKANRDAYVNSITIDETQFWRISHYEKIRQCYLKHPFFKDYSWLLDEIYLNNRNTNLSQFNINVIKNISNILGINTKFSISTDYKTFKINDDKLIELCKLSGATTYLSGPAGRDYIDETKFINESIILEYIDYSGYPSYYQKSNNFDHNVSILDLIFAVGTDAAWYIWGWRKK